MSDNIGRPKIVCLCGSTRFREQFEEVNRLETLAGNIVLSVGCYVNAEAISDEQKVALDELHKRKIDLADEVLIINVDNYLGESSRSEIAYAVNNLKKTRWLTADYPQLNSKNAPDTSVADELTSITNNLERLRRRAQTIDFGIWKGMTTDPENDHVYVPDGSYLGDTMIRVHDYEGDGHDCNYIQNLLAKFPYMVTLVRALLEKVK